MSLKEFTCDGCGATAQKEAGHVNRQRRLGQRLFCSRECCYRTRRTDTRTDEEKRADKAAYDREYRKRRGGELLQKRRDYYRNNRDRCLKKMSERRAAIAADPERAAAYKAKMRGYRERPEWKEHKREYDRRHRAERDFGEFADAYLTLLDLESEVEAQVRAEGMANRSHMRRVGVDAPKFEQAQRTKRRRKQ